MAEPRRVLNKQTMGIAPGLPLEIAGDDPAALRRAVQQLLDIEAIKQLKHAYFRCIDTANFEELGALFHEDVKVSFVGGNYEWKLQGREQYLENVKKSFTKQSIGHHNGHQPEIQILSETEATGVWYLADHMWILGANFHTTGTALYWDRYVKVDGRWTIRETSYERLYEMTEITKEKPPVSAHYLADHGSEVETAS